MIAILPVVLAPGFNFQGGNMLSLAKAIHDYSHQPTFVSSFAKLPSLTVDLSSESFLRDHFHEVIPPKLGLVGNFKNDWAFRPKALGGFYLTDTTSPYGMKQYELDNPSSVIHNVTIKDEKVILRGGSACGAMEEIALIKLTRPVRVHWFLQKFKVAFAFDRCPEKQFLKGIALATCGRLYESSSEYYIDCNPETFRKQWLERLAAEMSQETISHRKRRIRMSIDILGSLTPAQLNSILQSPGGWAHGIIDSNGKQLRIVQEYVNGYLRYCRTPKGEDDSEGKVFKYLFTTNGGPDWSKGLRWQVSYPDIVFLLDKKEQIPNAPKFVIRF